MRDLERKLVDASADHLRRQGLAVSVATPSTSDGSTVYGELEVRWCGGHHVFPIVVKLRLEPWTVPLLPLMEGGVVLTDHATPRLRSALADAGLGFVDGSGNASLTAPGLHVRIEERRRQKASVPSVSLPFSETGLPVTFILLVRGSVEQAGTQRELAELAQRSLGTTNRVLQALRKLGHVSVEGHLTRVPALRERWIEAYLLQDDFPTSRRRYDSDVWSSPAQLVTAPQPEGAYLGSEAAASALGHSIRPESVVLYCTPEARKNVVRAGRLRGRADGWIELRAPFWGPGLLDPEARTVPDLLIRADLMAEADPRLTALADEMRR